MPHTPSSQSASLAASPVCHSAILGRPVTLSFERVQALLAGTACGDALGLPVETFSAERISAEVGKVRRFLSNAHNPFLAGRNVPPGSASDDLQLTVAVLRAVTRAVREPHSLMDFVAQEHISALQDSDMGWGGSTKEAVKRLSEGIHWRESGVTEKVNRGLGNGIPMKIAPLALHALFHGLDAEQIVDLVIDFAGMTHRTEMAVRAGLSHLAAITYCLGTRPDQFSRDEFIELVSTWSSLAGGRTGFPVQTDDISARMSGLRDVPNASSAEIIDRYNGGGCYVYESLPFSYAFFLGAPHSAESLYRAIEAGGDTDSNGALVGGLLGALNGPTLSMDDGQSLLEVARRVKEWPQVERVLTAFL